jgi:hypothetical protein
VSGVSHAVDRMDVTFDDEALVADAGLIVPATLMLRLGLEALVNQTVRLVGRVGGALPGPRSSRWWRRSSPAAPTSITPTSCGRERRARCWRSG